ncbi:MAG: hypothetical protein EZS28_026426, partial [Streblomastix strix]
RHAIVNIAPKFVNYSLEF